MPATARCAVDLEQKLQISEASPSAKQISGSYAAAAGESPLPAAVEAAKKKEPKLISPALLAKTAPADLKHVLAGKVGKIIALLIEMFHM